MASALLHGQLLTIMLIVVQPYLMLESDCVGCFLQVLAWQHHLWQQSLHAMQPRPDAPCLQDTRNTSARHTATTYMQLKALAFDKVPSRCGFTKLSLLASGCWWCCHYWPVYQPSISKQVTSESFQYFTMSSIRYTSLLLTVGATIKLRDWCSSAAVWT